MRGVRVLSLTGLGFSKSPRLGWPAWNRSLTERQSEPENWDGSGGPKLVRVTHRHITHIHRHSACGPGNLRGTLKNTYHT